MARVAWGVPQCAVGDQRVAGAGRSEAESGSPALPPPRTHVAATRQDPRKVNKIINTRLVIMLNVCLFLLFGKKCLVIFAK